MKMVSADDKSAFIIQSNNLYEVYHGSDTLHILLSIGGHEAIKAVARDKNGIFWIGTEYGFGYFDSNTKEFTKIETKLFNSVSTLLLDEQERLWIGARNNMLFSYDLKKRNVSPPGENRTVIRRMSSSINTRFRPSPIISIWVAPPDCYVSIKTYRPKKSRCPKSG